MRFFRPPFQGAVAVIVVWASLAVANVYEPYVVPLGTPLESGEGTVKLIFYQAGKFTPRPPGDMTPYVDAMKEIWPDYFHPRSEMGFLNRWKLITYAGEAMIRMPDGLARDYLFRVLELVMFDLAEIARAEGDTAFLHNMGGPFPEELDEDGEADMRLLFPEDCE